MMDRNVGIIIYCTQRTLNEASMEAGLDGSMGRDSDTDMQGQEKCDRRDMRGRLGEQAVKNSKMGVDEDGDKRRNGTLRAEKERKKKQKQHTMNYKAHMTDKRSTDCV